MKRGHESNMAGQFSEAQRCFLEVYSMGGPDEQMAIARLSAANMALKMGELGEALAEYDDMLRKSGNLPPELVETMQRKRTESIEKSNRSSGRSPR